MTWLVVLAVGAGSFAFRLVPLLLLERKPLDDRGDRLVGHAGTAAISALVAISTQHNAAGPLLIPTLLSVGVATVLATRRASMIRLIVVGGAIYAAAVLVADVLFR